MTANIWRARLIQINANQKKALRLLQIYSARRSLNFESLCLAYPCFPARDVGAAPGSGFEGATPRNQAFSGVRDRDTRHLLQQSS